MNCKEVSRIIEGRRDLEDAPAASGELAEHAGDCARCRGLLDGEARLQAGLALLRRRRAVVPFGFELAVKRRIANRAERPAIGGWPLALSALASSAALVIVVVVAARDGARVDVAAGGSPTTRTAPVLWSNGRVEVVAEPAPDAARTPRQQPEQLAVLVEYDL